MYCVFVNWLNQPVPLEPLLDVLPARDIGLHCYSVWICLRATLGPPFCPLSFFPLSVFTLYIALKLHFSNYIRCQLGGFEIAFARGLLAFASRISWNPDSCSSFFFPKDFCAENNIFWNFSYFLFPTVHKTCITSETSPSRYLFQ